MPVDLKDFYDRNKSYFGDKPLADVAKEAYQKSGAADTHTYDQWLDWTGTGRQQIEEDRFNRLPIKDGSTLGALARTAGRIPENLLAKGIQAIQGQSGASVTDRGLADQYVNWVEKRNRDLAQEYSGSGDVPLTGGIISKKDVAELGPNLAYSGASLAGSIGGGIAGQAAAPFAPVAGAIAGGLAGSGAVAHRMSGYQTMNDWLEKKNRESIEKTGAGITPEQEAQHRAELESSVTKSSAWEAGPEAVGTMLEKAMMTTPMGKVLSILPKGVKGKVIAGVLRATGILAPESATETVTGMGQQRVESEAGMSNEAPRQWDSVKDWLKTAEEVLPAVLLQTGVMSAGGAAYRKIAGIKPGVELDVKPGETLETGPDGVPVVVPGSSSKIAGNVPVIPAPPSGPITGALQAGGLTGRIMPDFPGIADEIQPVPDGVSALTGLSPVPGQANIDPVFARTSDRIFGEDLSQSMKAELERSENWDYDLNNDEYIRRVDAGDPNLARQMPAGPVAEFQPMGAPSTAEQAAQVLSGMKTPAIDSAFAMQQAGVDSPYYPELDTGEGAPNEVTQRDIKSLSIEDLQKARPAFEARKRPDILSMIDNEIAEKKNKVPEHLRQVFGIMRDEANSGGIESLKNTSEGGRMDATTAVGRASSHAEWFQDLNKEIKDRMPEIGGIDKKTFDNLLTKKETGQTLTDRQDSIWKAMEDSAEKYNKVHPDTVISQDEARIKKMGFEPNYGQEVKLTELAPGDKVLFGDEEFHFKGFDDRGQIVFQDGDQFRVDPFETITPDGIKRAEKPGKDEIVPEERRGATGIRGLVDRRRDVLAEGARMQKANLEPRGRRGLKQRTGGIENAIQETAAGRTGEIQGAGGIAPAIPGQGESTQIQPEKTEVQKGQTETEPVSQIAPGAVPGVGSAGAAAPTGQKPRLLPVGVFKQQRIDKLKKELETATNDIDKRNIQKSLDGAIESLSETNQLKAELKLTKAAQPEPTVKESLQVAEHPPADTIVSNGPDIGKVFIGVGRKPRVRLADGKTVPWSAEWVRPTERMFQSTPPSMQGATKNKGIIPTSDGMSTEKIKTAISKERPGMPVEISELRKQFPEMSKADFDKALRDMKKSGEIELVRNAQPISSLTEEDKAGMVPAGDDNFFMAINPLGNVKANVADNIQPVVDREIPAKPVVDQKALVGEPQKANTEDSGTGSLITISKDDIPYDAAYNAHRGTSMTPDVRAGQVQEDYVSTVKRVHDDILKSITPEQRNDAISELIAFKQKYREKYLTWLSAKSRTMSTMVTGGSNFNTRRNDKANDAEHNKLTELIEWEKKAIKGMRKRLGLDGGTAISSDDSDAIDKLKEKIAKAESDQEKFKAINLIVKSKKLTDAEKIIKIQEDLGYKESTAKGLLEPDFAGRVGIAGYQLINNNANIRRMKERVAELEKSRAAKTTETEKEGVRIVDNVEENRLQMFFDGKPSEEIKDALKSKGFKWSPKSGAWQRYRSPIATQAADDIAAMIKTKPKDVDFSVTQSDILRTAKNMTETGSPPTIGNDLEWILSGDTVKVSHAITGRDFGSIDLKTGEITSVREQDKERVQRVADELREKAELSKAQQELSNLKDYPLKNKDAIGRILKQYPELGKGEADTGEILFSDKPTTRQIETPAFKAWFGDWEAAAIRNRMENTQPISVNLLPQHQGDRKSVMADAINSYSGRGKVINRETGNEIRIERSGLKSSLQHGIGPEKVAVMSKIDDLLEQATFVIRDIDNMRKGVVSVETYAIPVVVDTSKYIARLVVREVEDGRRFYDHELSTIESAKPVSASGGKAGAFAAKPIPRPLTSFGHKILRNAMDVKLDSISKVVNPDGTPMVVYHGTDAKSFDQFKTNSLELGSHFGTAYQANKFAVDQGKENRGSVYPVYLNIKNPLRLEDKGWFTASRVKGQLLDAGILNNSDMGELNAMTKTNAVKYMKDKIYEAGYDGIVYLNRREGLGEAAEMYDWLDGRKLNDMSDDEILSEFPEAEDAWIAMKPEQVKSAIGNIGSFDSTDPRIDFKTANTTTKRLGLGKVTAAKVRAEFKPLIDNLNAQGDVSLNIESDPSKIADDGLRRTVIAYEQKTGRLVRGFFHKKTGTLYVFTDRMGSIKEAAQIIAHELVGHHGLYEFLGDDLQPFLDFVNAHPEYGQQVRQTAKERRIDMSTQEGRNRASKEWFAELVEKGDIEPSLWSRFVVAFKNALRRMGIKGEYLVGFSKNDIAEIVRGSMRAVEAENQKQTYRQQGGALALDYSMGGKKAKTADLGLLAKAEQMEKDGESLESIWEETGWWKLGSDWKFEIDESKAKFKAKMGYYTPLGEILDHPKLYAQYPWLKEVEVTKVAGSTSSWNGKHIEIGAYDKPKSALIHEIQHAIQERENFARGGDPISSLKYIQGNRSVLESEISILKNALQEQSGVVIELDGESLSRQKVESLIQENKAKLKDVTSAKTGHEAYRRLTGEAESRLVQKRLGMTAAERKTEPPWVTLEKMLKSEGLLQEGQKPEDILIDRREGGAAMSAAKDVTKTPEFKKWVSDIEKADPFSDMRYARGSIRAKSVAQYFINKPLTNIDSGIVATVSISSLSKMLSRSAVDRSISPQAHMQAVANLDKLFTASVLRISRTDRNEGENIKAMHHFDVPMKFDNEVLNVKIMAKEYAKEEYGSRLYLVQAVEIEKPASPRVQLTSTQEVSSPVSIPPAGFDEKIAHLMAIVKGQVSEIDYSDTPAGRENRKDIKESASILTRLAQKANKDITGSSAWKPGAKTVNWYDRLVSLPMYYFDKVPQLRDALAVVQKSIRDKYNLQREIAYDPEGRAYADVQKKFRKENPKESARVDDWIKSHDVDRIGYRVKRSEDKETGLGKWDIVSPDPIKNSKGEFVEWPEADQVYDTRDEASTAMHILEGEQYIAMGGSLEGAKILNTFRTIGSNMLELSSRQMRQYIKEAQEQGLAEPKIVLTDENGKPVEVKLSVAIAMMGDLEGSYYPRRWKSGQYLLWASKEGEHKELHKFDLALQFDKKDDWRKLVPLPINLKVRELEKKGYKITLERAENLPEGVFLEASGQRVALEQIMNKAMENWSGDTKRTLADIGIQSKWKEGENGGNDFIIYGEGVDAKHHPDILEELGGKYHYVSSAKHGYPSIVFEGAEPGIEAKVKEFLFDYRMLRAGTDANIAIGFVTEVANIFKSRGGMVGRMKRSGAKGKDVVVGYEPDPIVAFTQAAMGLAGSTAKGLMAHELINIQTGRTETWAAYKERIEDTKHGDKSAIIKKASYKAYMDLCKERRLDPSKQQEADKDLKSYVNDVLRNEEQLDRIMGTLHGLATLKYLVFKVSSAGINLSSLVTSVPATMTGVADIPLTKVPGLLARALGAYQKFVFKKSEGLDVWTKRAMNHIKENGWDEQQFNHEAMSALKGKAGRRYQKFMEYGMFAFGITEQINRVSTIVATYQGIRDKHQGPWGNEQHDAALALAKTVSDRAHGDYSKANRSMLTRGGAVGANIVKMALVFKMYAHNFVLNMVKLGFKEKQYKAAAFMAISPMILAGAGAGVLTPIASMILKGIGIGGDDPEEEFYKWLEKEAGSTASNLARSGVVGLGGVGPSLSGSMNINLMEYPKTIGELFGAPGGVAKDLIDGYQEFGRGNYMKGAEKVFPTAAGNIIKAYRESTEGLTTKKNTPIFYGKDQVKLDNWEAAMRVFSFNPSRIAMIREKQYSEKQAAAAMQDQLDGIYMTAKKLFLKPYNERSEKDTADIIAMMTRYNQALASDDTLSKTRTPLTWKRIMTGVKRNLKPSKLERNRQLEE